MLRQIFAMTRKELRLILQKPSQLAVLMLVPLAFVAIMSQVFGRSSVPTVAVYALNEDTGRSGGKLMEALEREKTLDIQLVASRAEAEQRVGDGSRMAAIVIPPGFSAAILTDAGGKIEVIVDPAREQESGVVIGQVQAATAGLLIDAEVTRGVRRAFRGGGDLFGLEGVNLTDSGLDMAAVEKFLTAALKGVIASQVEDALDAPLVRSERVAVGSAVITQQPTVLDYFAPGYTIFFCFFIVGIMANMIRAERTGGSLRRLLTTPATRPSLLLGKIVPFYILAVVQMAAVLGMCTILFDFDLGNSPPALAMVILAGAAAVVGLGIMVAALVRSEGQAGALPDLLTIGMAVASGAMFPSIRLPLLQYFTPQFWTIQGIQDVVTRNLGPQAVLQETGILLAMAAIFFAIGVWRFRFE